MDNNQLWCLDTLYHALIVSIYRDPVSRGIFETRPASTDHRACNIRNYASPVSLNFLSEAFLIAF